MNILIENVTYEYPGGVMALRGVSLSIVPGEAVAIVGENGAGKTTLVKHMNGLLRPTQGRALVDGHDTRQRTVAQLARQVGYVFQNPDEQLFERRVWSEVAFGPRNLGQPDEEVQANVERALALVGLSDVADHHPYDLHIARRKLVALAATLAMQTPVIILDEPTTGQDAAGTALLGRIVESLKAEGRTVIAISHDIDFCAAHFERVIVMAGGVVLADGPVETVLNQEEALRQAEIEPPQLVRLARALGWNETPRTVEAFVEALQAQRRKKPPA